MHLVAQPSLRPDAEAVPDDQHPDHQLRIDRWPPCVAVIRCEVAPQITQVEDAVDAAEKMVGGNVRLEVKGIEELLLRRALLSHHRGVTSSLVVLCLQTRSNDGGSPSLSTKQAVIRSSRMAAFGTMTGRERGPCSRRHSGIRWALLAPCDFFGSAEKSLRRVASSRVSGVPQASMSTSRDRGTPETLPDRRRPTRRSSPPQPKLIFASRLVRESALAIASSSVILPCW